MNKNTVRPKKILPTGRKVPMRRCTGCRQMKEKQTLLRMVKQSDGTIRFDPTSKSDGRGAYVCKVQKCVDIACKNRGFERAFKSKIPKEAMENLKKMVINGGGQCAKKESSRTS